MPLIANTNLPTFEVLRRQGEIILDLNRAERQEIRPLHIGLLNMMPDKAFHVTEQQFLGLVSQSNDVLHFTVHLMTLDGIERSEDVQQHIAKYYESSDSVKAEGLDALIISGANLTGKELVQEAFWEPLSDIFDWAYNNVTSTICSCLASHSLMQAFYNQKRIYKDKKCWGVFSHQVKNRKHPLMRNMNTRFDIPHSRYNHITAQQFKQANCLILAEGKAGVGIATSPDGIRFVMLQGHPEYSTVSLLKEYKREISLYANQARSALPPLPKNYLGAQALAILSEYETKVERFRTQGCTLSDFPESLITPKLDNTWRDSASSLFGNWAGLVYQLTHVERSKPFMDHIDPDNPFGGI